MEKARGTVITFYSYKGGTGRSMALANVACLLSLRAEVQKGILAVDWDLEAPGLHHFFEESRLPLKNLEVDVPATPSGVLEIFQYLNSEIEKVGSEGPLSEDAAERIVRQVPFRNFVVKNVIPKVDLMRAGRFDGDYAERVNNFGWRHFFARAPALIRVFAEYLAELYDYVLIDSRTGLADVSGVCTTLVPDQLVFVFTPNRQSLFGGLEVIRKAASYRLQSDDLRPLAVFPLPSRIDVSEPELLEKWRFGGGANGGQGYQKQFEDLFVRVYGLPSCDLRSYFDEVQIQHVPRYSYGEEIAALVERGTRLSLSRSYAAFADILRKAEPPWKVLRSSETGAALASALGPSLIKLQTAKEYLAEERFKLKLHDLVTQETREVLSRTGEADFAVSGSWSVEGFAGRLRRYEAACADLVRLQALLGFWGEPVHRNVLTLGPRRICGELNPKSGLTTWLALRWYPALLLLYSGGIGAVAAGRYANLHELMTVPVSGADLPRVDPSFIRSVTVAVNDLQDAFKSLPGHERQYTPRSEYLYKFLQPFFEDLLFLGSEYEAAFDRFEVLYALEHAHRYSGSAGGRVWGPPGRFAWKFEHGDRGSPYHQVVAEAEAQGMLWPPVIAGLFGGSLDRFRELASGYGQTLSRLNWF